MRTMTEALARQAAVVSRFAPQVHVKGDLFSLFAHSPPDSLGALRLAMGPFKPPTDAFRFHNSFPLTAENAAQLQQHYQPVSDLVVGALVDIVTTSLLAIQLPVLGNLPTAVTDPVVGKMTDVLTGDLASKLVDTIIGDIPGTFGRCGGMAFSGYDFYLAGWPVDERLGTTPPATGVLGDYIFQRLLDSLDKNVATFLTWLMNYYVMPDAGKVATAALLGAAGLAGGAVGAALGVFIGTQVDIFNWGGPKVLLDQTKTQWPLLTARLDAQAAWPIGIVFSDTMNPIEQHQILAVGYHDPGDGTATLDVWDNNDGNSGRTLALDFRGDALQVTNFLNDRPVTGIFAEDYSPEVPPASLQLPLEPSEEA
jgi:hypothetical protein